jgi:hypothetical protein
VGLPGTNARKYFKASQLRHPDVEKREIKSFSLDPAQRLRSILYGSHRIARFLQHAGDRKARGAVVVGYKNFC